MFSAESLVRRRGIAGLLLACCWVSVGWNTPAVAEDQVPWVSDLGTARQMAMQQQRPILVHFWSEDCVPCKIVDRDVFAQGGVATALPQHVIPVKLNAREHSQVAQQLGVDRWPTDVVLAPDGRMLGKMVSPQDPQQYVTRIASMAGAAGLAGMTSQVAQNSAAAAQVWPAAHAGSSVPPVNAAQPNAYPANAYPDPYAPPADPMLPPAGAYQSPGPPPTIGSYAAVAPGTTQQPAYTNQAQYAAQAPYAASAPYAPTVPGGAGGPVPAVGQGMAAPAVAAQGYPAEAYGAQAGYSAPPGYAGPGGYQGPAGASQPNLPAAPYGDPNSQPGAASGLAVNPPVEQQIVTNPYANQGQVPAAGSYPPSAPAPNYPQSSGYPQPSAVPSYAAMPGAGQASWDPASAPNAATMPAAAPQPHPGAMAPGAMAAASGPADSSPTATGTQLGLDGFCPVTLADERRWAEGDTRWGAVHRGRTYLFANEPARQRFMADPDSFSPMLSGFDPVAYIDTNRMLEGSRAHGIVYRDQVFLFSSEDNLNRFCQNPNRYEGSVLQAMGGQRGTDGRITR